MEKDEPDAPKFSWAIFLGVVKNSGRITRLLWSQGKGRIIALGCLNILTSLIPFLSSGVLALLINELVRDVGIRAFSSALIWLTVSYLAVRVIPPFLQDLQSYLSNTSYLILNETLEILIIERKGEIDLAVHEDPKQNDLFTKVRENGVGRVQNFADRQFYLVQSAIQVIAAGIILIFSKWWLFLIIVAGTVPELFDEIKHGNRTFGIYNAQAETRRRFWDFRGNFDSVSSLTELKLFQNVEHFIGLIKNLFRNFIDEEVENEREKLWHSFLAGLTSQLVVAFAIAWYITQTVQGFILIGTLTFLLSSVGNLRGGLSALFQSLGRQYQDSLFVTDVFKLVDIKPVLKRKEIEIALDAKKTPEIVFDRVSFAYPGTTKPVLKNFSLKILPGEKVAFVGANGAGKTTIIKLLCRFYDPTAGRIMIDGHDLRDIDLESWYGEIGALFQEYAHYNFLAKEAIGLGNTKAPFSLPRAKQAAQDSEADEFIREWGKNYEQMLGKRFSEGIEPSIGQWQKLALARTFYRDPRILILDEPTSSIDAEAEAKIFEKLESLLKDITVILISHRFSTVRQANRIIVLKDGAIAEQGTHRDLMKRKGDYARLFTMQAKQYK
jgi:ABC-type multidrug transport system fused ATPase/permease subunit